MSSVFDVLSFRTPAGTGSTTKTGETKSQKEIASASKSSEKTNEAAAVYEKSSDKSESIISSIRNSRKNANIDNEAIVRQLQQEAETRAQQLADIVNQSLSQQGITFQKSQGLASIFESLTVSEDVKLQAQKDVAEDGYWGVNQTSDRIVDFAKALSGNDKSKAEELLAAFKKGYEKATKAWGKDLPELCQNTYAAVEEKFQKWMNEEG